MTDFEVIYARYSPLVRRFALFLSGDPALADDITSETFVRAWTTPAAIREETVKAYLFTIARNLYRDTLRRSRRHERLGDGVRDDRTNVEQRVEDRSEIAVVVQQMQALPEMDRAALLMRAQEDMTYDAIARALGISLASVKVKIHRARLKLLNARRREDA